jgi:peptidoglycan L-alanyl-D-glutamate endopeptidase CwlK
MGIIRGVDALKPECRTMVIEAQSRLAYIDFPYRIDETYREQAVQNAYYAQGRESLEVTNGLRKHAGLYLLTEDENKRIVTSTLLSRHTEREAVDIVPLLTDRNGKFFVPWDYDKYAEVWLTLGEIMEAVGFEWGGRWPPLGSSGLGWDPPHNQMRR